MNVTLDCAQQSDMLSALNLTFLIFVADISKKNVISQLIISVSAVKYARDFTITLTTFAKYISYNGNKKNNRKFC